MLSELLGLVSSATITGNDYQWVSKADTQTDDSHLKWMGQPLFDGKAENVYRSQLDGRVRRQCCLKNWV